MALAFAAAFLIGAGRIFPPHFKFVWDEYGQSLLLADRIIAGQVLYRDIFSPYGPLPIYAHAGVAAVFGNSPATFQWFIAVGNMVSLVLAARLLLRWLKPVAAMLWAAVILGGLFLRELSLNTYPPFEAVFFLSALLCWRAPGQRSAARSLALGVSLGLMQTAKFGGVFIAGFCILLADAGQWLAEGRAPAWGMWLRSLAWIAAGALLVGGALAAWLFYLLPAANAADVLWPSYMRDSYTAYMTPDLRFFCWRGLGFFARVQAPPLMAATAAITLALAWRRLRPPPTTAPDPVRAAHAGDFAGLAMGLGAFFPVALAIYLPHLWVSLHYFWIPELAAGGALAFFGPFARGLLVLTLTAGVWEATIHPVLAGNRVQPGSEKATFPNGQELWVTPGEAVAFQAVLERSARLVPREAGAPPTWMVFPGTFGWEHFSGGKFRVGAPGFRHWWFWPAFVRPREEAALIEALGRVDAVLVDLRSRPASPVGPDPRSWGWIWPRFSPCAASAIAARLDPPEELAPNLWCFPVRR